MTDRELMQQALEAFVGLLTFNPSPAEYKQGRDVVSALRDRLAQPERQWVGLKQSDMPSEEHPMFDHQYFIAGMVYAAKVLEEKNT